MQASNAPAFGETAARLGEAIDSLERATQWLLAQKTSDATLAGATPYLRMFGHAAGGCMLAEQALAALRDSGDGAARIALARFFAENIAVQASGLERGVTEGADSITDAQAALGRMSDLVIISDDGPVRTVRMNRPEKKNALTLAMYDAMAGGIESAAQNPALRCLLIAGAPTAFCAGNDIGDFIKMATGAARSARRSCAFSTRWRAARLPLVAAVQGNAVGVGTTMLMHCDHVVAAATRAFRRPSSGSAWCRKPLPA